jgi:hypothetical protein
MSNIQEVQKLASWVEGIQSDHSRWARYSCQANMSLVWDWIAERHLAMSPASVIAAFESFESTGQPALAVLQDERALAEQRRLKEEARQKADEQAAIDRISMENELFALQKFIASAKFAEPSAQQTYIKNQLNHKTLTDLREMKAEILRRRQMSQMTKEELRGLLKREAPATYDGVHPIMPAKWTGGRNGTIARASVETIRNLNSNYGRQQVNERLNQVEGQ